LKITFYDLIIRQKLRKYVLDDQQILNNERNHMKTVFMVRIQAEKLDYSKIKRIWNQMAAIPTMVKC